MTDDVPAVAVAPEILPPRADGEAMPERRPGRPKGSTNRNRIATVDRINQEADPIGFLARVVRGGKIKAAPEPGSARREWVYPTLDQRTDAALTLARKIMPDLRAVEIEGGVDNHLIVRIIKYGEEAGGSPSAE